MTLESLEYREAAPLKMSYTILAKALKAATTDHDKESIEQVKSKESLTIPLSLAFLLTMINDSVYCGGYIKSLYNLFGS